MWDSSCFNRILIFFWKKYRYLVVTSFLTDEIVWWFGPCPAATSEISMVRLFSFSNGTFITNRCYYVGPGKRTPWAAAKWKYLPCGWRCCWWRTAHYDSLQIFHCEEGSNQEVFNRRLSLFWWRVESAFARLKQSKIFRRHFRHHTIKHKLIWALVTFLYN